MSISVIIPTFNRASLLPRALHSVLNQTRSPDEIIVVDDGSTDNTRDQIADQFPQIHYVYQENQGVSAARNRGI
ncbi:MAG TPA: glycosyltransferase family 2 protein, partial [candidate division Zixibacteria bacterium]|nr:glycosyltransferase family 2 protein [candidate division Zixibacteria bacterium]